MAPEEEPDAPLRQSAIPDGYPFSRAWGERVGTPEVLHEVIRVRIRPRAAVDFRRGVWHEKARLSRLCWPTRGFGTLAYVWGYCYPITKAPQASINSRRLSKKPVLK